MVIKPEYQPPWSPRFTSDGEVECILCHNKEISVLVRDEDTHGICEPCSVIAHHLWRRSPGEVPPQYPDKPPEISRVYVLLAKLMTDAEASAGLSLPVKAEPTGSQFYKFAVRKDETEAIDLPWVKVMPGESQRAAAERALGLISVATWPTPSFIESLYTGFTPRGRLATVMLVTAWRWSDINEMKDKLDWRKWPIAEHVTSMQGFHKNMESVWRVRLQHHFLTSSHTDEISVQVKSAACHHIAIMQGVVAKSNNLDMSCVEIYK